MNRTKSGESKFVYLLLDKSRTTRLADDTASPVQSRAETIAGSSGETAAGSSDETVAGSSGRRNTGAETAAGSSAETAAGSSGRRNRGAESDDAEWTDV